MDLNGVWRALPATDDLRRNGVGIDVDDSSWHQISVPGHWQHSTGFEKSTGPVIYRTHFTAPRPNDGERRWLTLDGVLYQADVWLDGAYLGDPEGYFFSHSYDITDLSRLDEEHVVAVEVACASEADPRARRNITGALQPATHQNGWNPGGLWRPVRVHTTGPARLDRLRVLCRDANEHRAHVLLTALIDVDTSRRVTVRTSVNGVVQFASEQQLAAGSNDVSWTLDIGDPDLWWPFQLGEQPLTDITVELVVDGDVSDTKTRTTGLREAGWRNWQCSINGERLFLRGANLLPTRLALADATESECREDLELARAAGLNMVRLHGHVARSETYEAADRLGLLVMQDFPLQGEYSRSIRGAAARQARAMVDTLGHHPSIVHWNSHSDAGAANPGWGDDHGGSRWSAALRQIPKWDRRLLDRSIKGEIEHADPTRAVEFSSGALPGLPSYGGSDSHSYFGWFQGQLTDLSSVARQAPNLLRFVSEFGSAAASLGDSTVADQAERSGWPHLDWTALEADSGVQKAIFDRHVPPANFATAADWSTATQLYQAQVLQYQIELLRRMKYHPTGGFAFFCLNDSRPGVSYSVLDDHRRPKLGYDAVALACTETIAVADPMPTRADPGDRVSFDVVVVNDAPNDLGRLRLDVTVDGADTRVSFEGDVVADSTAKVGNVAFVMPSQPVTVHLTLTGNGLSVTNRYRVTAID